VAVAAPTRPTEPARPSEIAPADTVPADTVPADTVPAEIVPAAARSEEATPALAPHVGPPVRSGARNDGFARFARPKPARHTQARPAAEPVEIQVTPAR
jgi:hypothetical protein